MISRAGQANEAGSVHRRGVAVFLAAHGLAGRAVADAAPGPDNPVPESLAFETVHATDDLLCTLSDRTRLFISAKRTCGKDKHLKATVQQWLDDVDTLQPGDRLILATAAPTGPVRHLGAALHRRRAAPATEFPPAEQDALDALRSLMAGTPVEKQDRLLDAAAVLIVDAAEAGRPQHELASALLEGTVVPPGWGDTALSHLNTEMHTEAGKAYSGDVDAWIARLAALRVPVFADRQGPAGASARARQVALEQYRTTLQAVAGHVDLSLLAEDVDPLVIEDLIDHVRVTFGDVGDAGSPRRESVSLLAAARRVPQLLVEGLPGAGKSAAVDQLAARWAADVAAPLPIVVRLRELASQCRISSDVRLSLLVELAAEGAPENQRADLINAMNAAIADGEAVLLLDGLDECLDRRARVAQGLKPVITGLPEGTGVLLTTRPSGVAPAARLGLPAAQLAVPANLDAVLERLLQHLADARVPNSAHRLGWIAQRAGRVREILRAHPDLGSVPLLAVLVTLVVADASTGALPVTSAGVLRAAVSQTVERWERGRAQLPERFAVRPTDRMLLAGFAAIGHLLGRTTTTSADEVHAAVTSVMSSPGWGFAAERAGEAARAIQWFWDDHVGVFVAGATGHVRARSWVFTEIGAAMYCPVMSADELSEWISSAVADPDRHTALLMAAQLDNRVVAELLSAGESADERAALAATALGHGAPATDEQAQQLLSRLGAAATAASTAMGGHDSTRMACEDEHSTPADVAIERIEGAAQRRRLRRDGSVWPWALEIVRLPVPASLESRRAELVGALPLSAEQRVIASGIAAFASADRDGRRLSAEEADRVLQMLRVPPPPKGEGLRHVARNRVVLETSVGLIDGLGQAVARAAARLPELPSEATDLISSLASRAAVPDATAISTAMAEHGHPLDLLRLPEETVAFISRAADDYRQGHRVLLETAAGLSAERVPLTPSQRWRLPDLCDLLHLLGAGETRYGDFWTAMEGAVEHRLSTWLRIMTVAADLDQHLVAGQARAALLQIDNHHLDLLLEMFYATPGPTADGADIERLVAADRDTVVALLTVDSDWIANWAGRLLWEVRTPGLDDRIAALLDDVPPPRRFLLAVLSCVVSEQPIEWIGDFLESADPAVRRAAAAAARGEEADPEVAALRSRALRDADATVRLAAGAATLDDLDHPPRHWSCRGCSTLNAMDAEDCRGCTRGTRPRPKEEQ